MRAADTFLRYVLIFSVDYGNIRNMNIDELFECEYFEGEVVCDSWEDAHCTILRVKNAGALPCDLAIPSQIEDEYYVTEIADGAFFGLSGLRSVTIPDTVTDVGENAFADCKNLTAVTLGADIESISKNAFLGCDSIADVYIRNVGAHCARRFGNRYSNPVCSAKRIFIDDVPVGDCLEIPAKVGWYSIDKISDYAFCGLRIKTLELADGIEKMSIAPDAFSGCDELAHVVLPDSLKSLDPSGLLSCKSLKFNEYGGARYLGSKSNPYKALVLAADAPSLTLHPDTQIICRGAFSGCVKLNKLYVSAHLIYGDKHAFTDCPEPITVVLPDDITVSDLRKPNGNKKFVFNEYKGLEYLGSERNPYKMVVGYSQAAQSYELHPDTEIIGADAFANNTKLESFVASDKVTYINEHAFRGCVSLEKIFLPSGLKYTAAAFEYGGGAKEVHCPSIADWCGITFACALCVGFEVSFDLYLGNALAEDVVVPNGVEAIKANAFCKCGSIKRVTLPESIRRIGDHAFFKCAALQSVHIPDGAQSIEQHAFRYCDALKTVTTSAASIGYMAFANCKSLESVYLKRCGEILSACFLECRALKCAEIAGGVDKIRDETFKNCTSLHTVKLPESLSYIGCEAFKGCGALEEIEFPDSVKTIKAQAFRDCMSLKSVKLTAVEEIEQEAFEHCTALESVSIAGDIKYLAQEIFRECKRLTSVGIPLGVEYIGGDAFRDCVFLREIALPASLKHIVNRAFINCGLESIVIPDGVEYIGEQAFWHCGALTRAEIPDTVVKVGRDIFALCNSALNIVASDTVKALLDKPNSY